MKHRTRCLEQARKLPVLFLMTRTLEMAFLQAKQIEGSQPKKIDVIKHNFTQRPMHQCKSIKYSLSAKETSMKTVICKFLYYSTKM